MFEHGCLNVPNKKLFHIGTARGKSRAGCNGLGRTVFLGSVFPSYVVRVVVERDNFA